MLNVLFVTRKWEPSVGGMETYSMELSAELKKMVNLQVYCLCEGKDNKPPGFLSVLFFFLKALVVCFNKRSVDVLHVGDMVLWPLAMCAIVFNRKSTIVASAHGTDVAYHLRRGILPYIYKIYITLGALMLASRLKVIANSNATSEYCKYHGFKDVYVVPLGVRVNSKYTDIIQHGEPYILFVGRLSARKGVGWFVENVLLYLPADIKLKIAGPIWDNKEIEVIKGSSRCEYLGSIFDSELSKIRRNSLVVIMPNIDLLGRDFEGFGLTAIEAAADGAILLASNIDGIVDAVSDGQTGWLLPSGNGTAWIKKINEISMWSIDKRLSFTSNAREIIKKYYSWNRVAQDTVNIYVSTKAIL